MSEKLKVYLLLHATFAVDHVTTAAATPHGMNSRVCRVSIIILNHTERKQGVKLAKKETERKINVRIGPPILLE